MGHGIVYATMDGSFGWGINVWHLFQSHSSGLRMVEPDSYLVLWVSVLWGSKLREATVVELVALVKSYELMIIFPIGVFEAVSLVGLRISWALIGFLRECAYQVTIIVIH